MEMDTCWTDHAGTCVSNRRLLHTYHWLSAPDRRSVCSVPCRGFTGTASGSAASSESCSRPHWPMTSARSPSRLSSARSISPIKTRRSKDVSSVKEVSKGGCATSKLRQNWWSCPRDSNAKHKTVQVLDLKEGETHILSGSLADELHPVEKVCEFVDIEGCEAGGSGSDGDPILCRHFRQVDFYEHPCKSPGGTALAVSVWEPRSSVV